MNTLSITNTTMEKENSQTEPAKPTGPAKKIRKSQEEAERERISWIEARMAEHADDRGPSGKFFSKSFYWVSICQLIARGTTSIFSQIRGAWAYKSTPTGGHPPMHLPPDSSLLHDPSPESVKDPAEIVTWLRRKYPKAKPSSFWYLENLGWCHYNEASSVGMHAFFCSLSKKWYLMSSEEKHRFEHAFDNGTFARYVCTKDAAIKEGMVQGHPILNPTTLGVWFKESAGVPIWINTIAGAAEVKSSYEYRDMNCFLSSLSNRYFVNSHKVKIYDSVGKVSYIDKSEMSPAVGAVCPNCNRYTWSQHMIVKQGGSPWCSPCYEHSTFGDVIEAYNSKSYPEPVFVPISRLGHIISDTGMVFSTMKPVTEEPIRKFGVELEMEFSVDAMVKACISRKHIAKALREYYPDLINIKEDGTLTQNGKYSDSPSHSKGAIYAGFEVVTGPFCIRTQREMWKKFDKFKYHSILRAWDVSTCGMHVHVSRISITSLTLGRMLRWINHKHNKRFVEVIAGRSEQKFTRYVPKDISSTLYPEKVVNPDEDSQYNRNRRTALNVSNTHTVEFRIFRGTVNPSHIIRNIEFCEAVCNFAYPASRSFVELDHPKFFVDYVAGHRKDYPELWRWMVHHKLIVGPSKSSSAKSPTSTTPPEAEDRTDTPFITSAVGEKGTISWTQFGAPMSAGSPMAKSEKVIKRKVEPKKPYVAYLAPVETPTPPAEICTVPELIETDGADQDEEF